MDAVVPGKGVEQGVIEFASIVTLDGLNGNDKLCVDISIE